MLPIFMPPICSISCITLGVCMILWTGHDSLNLNPKLWKSRTTPRTSGPFNLTPHWSCGPPCNFPEFLALVGLILDVLECFRVAARVLPQSYCQHRCHVNVQAKQWWKCQIQDCKVSIKHRVSAERVTWTFDWKILWDTTSLTDLTAGFPSDGMRIRCWLFLFIIFFWSFFCLFWKEVNTLKIRDASWVWTFSRMSGISGKLASMFKEQDVFWLDGRLYEEGAGGILSDYLYQSLHTDIWELGAHVPSSLVIPFWWHDFQECTRSLVPNFPVLFISR